MSLEGRIRDLGLAEVCQLLGLSRKTGTLEIGAPLKGVVAEIDLLHGMVVDAASWPAGSRRPARGVDATPAVREIEECVLELLTWADGHFRFRSTDPATAAPATTRIALEPLLVEAAQRAEVWERVSDRLPHASVVPAFVDVDPHQLPLLRLVPQEWEVLTRVDGRRTLRELALVLGRDLLDVAGIVHGLIGSGLLSLREPQPAQHRRHATPPAHPALPGPDLWVPDASTDDGYAPPEDDVLFDPLHAGVVNAAGLPRMRTPLVARTVTMVHDACGASREAAAAHPVEVLATVASFTSEPSLERGGEASTERDASPASLCRLGDEAARRGDLARAQSLWSAALRSDARPKPGDAIVNADRVREAIALATRLHALLHPS